MPRVIVIAEGLRDHDGTLRHQTIFSERIDPERLSLGGFRTNLHERLLTAIADALDVEEHPPARPLTVADSDRAA